MLSLPLVLLSSPWLATNRLLSGPVPHFAKLCDRYDCYFSDPEKPFYPCSFHSCWVPHWFTCFCRRSWISRSSRPAQAIFGSTSMLDLHLISSIKIVAIICIFLANLLATPSSLSGNSQPPLPCWYATSWQGTRCWRPSLILLICGHTSLPLALISRPLNERWKVFSPVIFQDKE